LLRLVDAQVWELSAGEFPDGVGEIDSGLPAKGFGQVDIGDKVHGFVGVERHLAEADIHVEAKLTTYRSYDGTESEGLASADVEDVPAREGSFLQDEADCFGYVLDRAKIADLHTGGHAEWFAFEGAAEEGRKEAVSAIVDAREGVV
jgi:hypothetical protein